MKILVVVFGALALTLAVQGRPLCEECDEIPVVVVGEDRQKVSMGGGWLEDVYGDNLKFFTAKHNRCPRSLSSRTKAGP